MKPAQRREVVRWAAKHVLKLGPMCKAARRDAARKLIFEVVVPANDRLPPHLREWIKTKHPDVTRLAGEAADLCADVDALGLADAHARARAYEDAHPGTG